MSTLATTIWSDFFCNWLEFASSPDDTLQVISQTCQRLSPLILPLLYKEAGDQEILLTTDRYRLDSSQDSPVRLKTNIARLPRIAKALNTELVYIELNFNSIVIASGAGHNRYSISLEELLADAAIMKRLVKQGYQKRHMEQALIDFPAFGQSLQENLLQLYLLEKLLGKSVDIPRHEVLVLSGELVWTGWLNTFLLTHLFELWLGDNDMRAIIDRSGVWQVLLYSKRAEYFRLDASYFKANLHYIASGNYKNQKNKGYYQVDLYDQAGEKQKTLTLSDSRANVFELEQDYYFNDGSLCQGVVFFPSLAKTHTKTSIARWWPEKEFLFDQPRKFNLNPELAYVLGKEEFRLDYGYQTTWDISAGDYIAAGENVGKYHYRGREFQKVHAGSGVELAILDGQYINKGELLYHTKGRLVDRKQRAEYSGSVDYSLLDMDIIAFNTTIVEQQLVIPFSARCLDTKKNSAKMEVTTLKLGIHKVIGESYVQGVLTDKYLPAESAPQLLMQDWVEFKQQKLLNLFILGVKTVVLFNVSQTELTDYINANLDYLKHVTLIIVDILSAEFNANRRLLSRFVGNYAFSSADSLHLILNNKEELNYLQIQAAAIRKPSASPLNSLAMISYEQGLHYARIENNSTNLANVCFYGKG